MRNKYNYFTLVKENTNKKQIRTYSIESLPALLSYLLYNVTFHKN